MGQLVAYDTEQLPPELLLDTDHPANDIYMQNLRQIERMLVAQSATMRPLHADIIKRRHAGVSNVQIAEDLNITPQTVSSVGNSTKGKRLRALMAHYEFAIEGPNEAQRRNALWRIALDNEEDEPKTSISAIAELNRMTLAEYAQSTQNAPQTTTIIINQNILPKGPLDQ